MIKEAINGHGTKIWRSVVLAILGFLGAWMFYEVVGADEKFASKTEVKSVVHSLERIEGKVDDINRYLRDRK